MHGVCNSCSAQSGGDRETRPTVNVVACCSVCDPVRPQTGPREVRSGVRGGTVLSGPHDYQRHPSRRHLYRLHVQRGPAKSTLSDCGHFCCPRQRRPCLRRPCLWCCLDGHFFPVNDTRPFSRVVVTDLIEIVIF